MGEQRPRKALVIGAGPVGALTALSLHRRGWEVEVWESREDPRGKDTQMANLRSINLNMSARGLEALRSVDPSLADMLQNESIPMKGRMIHHLSPNLPPESQIYDPKHNQVGYSLSRPILNQRLVEALPAEVVIRFKTKLSRIDFRRRLAWGKGSEGGKAYKLGDEGGGPAGDQTTIRDEGSNPERTGKSRDTGAGDDGEDAEGTGFDLVVGADGSWSKVRQEIMRVERVDFSQSFIQHAYIELHMPPDPAKPGGYAIDANHLHIWPRHAFMLIGLPNKDGSFTLTLFLPFSSLQSLDTRAAAEEFFRANFPSAVNIVGIKRLVDDFESNPRGNLVQTHVLPTAWSSHAILLGDSSHSMVPFYGQGLNCGLEDVRILNSFFERHAVSPTTSLPLGETEPSLEEALGSYSYERDRDLQAICELAMNNYVEMRSKVLSPWHHLRRQIDYVLGQPVRGWNSLYEMVTFRPDIGYAAALERERWQSRVVERVGMGLGVVALGLGLAGGLRVSRLVTDRLR